MNTELSLQELSRQHLNEAVTDFADNTRKIRVSEFANDNNSVLRLKMQRKELTEKINYWRTKVDNNE